MGVWEEEDSLGYYYTPDALIPGLADWEMHAIEMAAIHAHERRHTIARAWRIEGGYGGCDDNDPSALLEDQ